MRECIRQHEPDGVGVSTISCWEIAQLTASSRLDLTVPVADWFAAALGYPGVQLLELTPEIAIEANYLPSTFHRDPADRIIVATARIMGCELLTADSRILAYPGVRLAKPPL